MITTSTKRSSTFAISSSIKYGLIVLLIGIAIAIGKSPAFFGIIVISAAYFSYALIASAIVSIVALVTGFFAKKEADTEVGEDLRRYQRQQQRDAESVNPQPAPQAAPRQGPQPASQVDEEILVDTDPVAMAAAALSHLSPEQIMELVSKFTAGQQPSTGGAKGRGKQ
jgi:hypothetical protein